MWVSATTCPSRPRALGRLRRSRLRSALPSSQAQTGQKPAEADGDFHGDLLGGVKNGWFPPEKRIKGLLGGVLRSPYEPLTAPPSNRREERKGPHPASATTKSADPPAIAATRT